MKSKIKIIVIAIVLIALGVASTGWITGMQINRKQSARIEEQAKVIDSLLNLPPTISVSARMDVTDKSKIDVNGKNNQGTINVPTERVYVLELQIDSTKMEVFRK